MEYQRPDTDKICLYVQRSRSIRIKVSVAINGRAKVGSEVLKNPKVLTDYSQIIYNIYKNIKH